MNFSSSTPPSRPAVAAAAQDLSDAEFAELDDLLAGIPEPLDPVDVVMLDGFLCGVIVQPSLLPADTWLPYVFDSGGHRWGEAEPSAEQLRARELILRRHAALNRSLAEFAGFDPFILEPDDAQDELSEDVSRASDESASAGEISEAASVAAPGEPIDPVVRAVQPWVAGFASAAQLFPGLVELEDDAVALNFAHLGRYLPAETDEEIELAATFARESPIVSLDDAIVGIVGAVANLYDLTEPLRYKVEAVRHEAPKVGRNDPCPCGSGKKFKQCHGVRA
jgi:uncharacterized protein